MIAPAERTSAPTDLIGPGRLVLVVGPSGAGKDTLIAGARMAFSGDLAIVFPRRVVTRAAGEFEDHDSLSEDAFGSGVENGTFALWWRAHSLGYGIPHTINDDLRAGCTVVCNVSRAIVPTARTRYSHAVAVLVTAPPDVLRARLSNRSRPSDHSLADRIGRNDIYSDFRAEHTINNAGSPAAGIRELVEIIKDGRLAD